MNEKTTTISVPAKVLNRDMLLLLFGQFISRTGTSVSSLVLILWIKDATDSASLMGFLSMVTGLTSLAFGAVGGPLADQFSRRRIIAWSDGWSGVAMIGLSILFFSFPDETGLLVAGIIVMSLFVSSADAFSTPAISAALPDLVSNDGLVRANSISQTSMHVGILLGQVVAGAMYRMVGVPIIALANGVTYLVAAVAESAINLPQVGPGVGVERASWGDRWRMFAATAKEGLLFIWKHPGMKQLVVGSSLVALVEAPVIIMIPFYVTDVLRAMNDWVGYLAGTYGAGGMAGFVVAGLIQLEGRHRGWSLIVMMLLNGVMVVALGATYHPFPALGIAFVSGLCGGFIVVYVTTLVQLHTPGEARGSVFGFLGTASGVLSPLGAALGGVILDWLDKDVMALFLYSGSLIVLIVGFVSFSKEFRGFLSSTPLHQKPSRDIN